MKFQHFHLFGALRSKCRCLRSHPLCTLCKCRWPVLIVDCHSRKKPELVVSYTVSLHMILYDDTRWFNRTCQWYFGAWWLVKRFLSKQRRTCFTLPLYLKQLSKHSSSWKRPKFWPPAFSAPLDSCQALRLWYVWTCQCSLEWWAQTLVLLQIRWRGWRNWLLDDLWQSLGAISCNWTVF